MVLPHEVHNYDFTFTHAINGMALISPDGSILKVNSALYKLLGYNQNQFSSSSQFIHFIEETILEITQIRKSPPPKDRSHQLLEHEYSHPAGHQLCLHINISTILDNHQSPIFYFAQFENKTVLQQLETKLQYVESMLNEKEDFFQQLFEDLPLTVLITKKGVIKYANPAGLRLVYANHLDDVLGMSTNEIVDTLSHSTLFERRKKYDRSKTIGSVQYLIRCLNGQHKYVEGFSMIITYRGETAALGIFKDISEQKVEEERIMQSEKLSTAGQLAAGIAHEIRNPLTAINGFMKLLRSSNSKKEQYIEIIESELKRIEFIVNELLILSKPQSTQTSSPINIIPLLNQVVTLMNGQAALKKVEIITTYPDEQTILIHGVAYQLKQVFINLLKNAVEAMFRGGNIYVHIRTKEDQVEVIVQDEGCGMTEEQINALGRPFYTTKDTGTGLGFIITSNIVHNHGGTITVKSVLQEGTAFTITLPLIITDPL